MARWKLIVAHYLSVEGKEWEQMEVDQMTGQEVRKRYAVPYLLDVKDPKLWNGNVIRNPRGEVLDGDIIVAYKDKAHESRDYLFTGDPTPDMFPLDDEAREISESFTEKWQAKPSEDNNYGHALMQQFANMKESAANKDSNVKIEGMSDMLQAMTAMMQQNAALIATLTSVKASPEAAIRRA
jgi:hypothetical protein